MALPAGRYGVTKNQLLKIKKLPMNTIKLIEDLYEKYSLLGSAAFKNSTSVVTESSDLVESGAVYIALQGKADNSVIGTVEGANASKAWSVGEHFIKDGAFKEVTQPIASGGEISSSNTVDKPIADILTGLNPVKVTGITVDGTIIKSVEVNECYVYPALKLAVISLAAKVGTFAEWTSTISGLPKPALQLSINVLNAGNGSADIGGIITNLGRIQFVLGTGVVTPIEDQTLRMTAVYVYNSLS